MLKQAGAHVLLTVGLADIETEIRSTMAPVAFPRWPGATH